VAHDTVTLLQSAVSAFAIEVANNLGKWVEEVEESGAKVHRNISVKFLTSSMKQYPIASLSLLPPNNPSK
jgi:hypothetical protein